MVKRKRADAWRWVVIGDFITAAAHSAPVAFTVFMTVFAVRTHHANGVADFLEVPNAARLGFVGGVPSNHIIKARRKEVASSKTNKLPLLTGAGCIRRIKIAALFLWRAG